MFDASGRWILAALIVPATVSVDWTPEQERSTLIVATTTSLRDSGLLDALVPHFERATGYSVKVIAVGSGQAMALARRGEADVVLAHDPEREAVFVADGFGLDRRLVMSNEFVIVGPPDDPARIHGVDVARALVAIRDVGAPFASRSDNSGTHAREQELWRLAGIAPEPTWYRETGQGMGATLQIAHELQAYTLTDVSTLLAHRGRLRLETLVSGDSLLRNDYHVMRVNKQRFPWINGRGAVAFTEYLLDPATQEVIGAFGREQVGQALFAPATPRLHR